MVLRIYSWLCTLGSFLSGSKGHMGYQGLDLGWPCARQASSLSTVVSLRPLFHTVFIMADEGREGPGTAVGLWWIWNNTTTYVLEHKHEIINPHWTTIPTEKHQVFKQ